jgi:aspartate ammonia-lyase
MLYNSIINRHEERRSDTVVGKEVGKEVVNNSFGFRSGSTMIPEEHLSGEGKFRIEHDSIGDKEVPIDAYYGVQTLRAAENFLITGLSMHPDIIYSIVYIKKAAAKTNCEIGLLDPKKADAIVKACDEILDGKFLEHFIVDPIQGGAGTSINMNANEVIANRAIELLGGKKGDYSIIHPNDHVNKGQSTNDVIPTAGKMTAIKLLLTLRFQIQCLYLALEKKAIEFKDVIKMGRTQLQDAVPVSLGQEFQGYADAVKRNEKRLEFAVEEMTSVNLGGTAIGTGINADKKFIERIVPVLNEVIGWDILKQATNMIDSTQNLDSFVAVSGIVKSCAVTLSKIANDLRLLSSGPRAGLGEISLPAKQNGSSIMPGKVNPVIPEVVNQVAFNVIGNDTTITLAAEAGQLELNAFEPILFYNLFQSIDTLGFAVETFTDNCITGIVANEKRCRELVDNSIGIVTILAPEIGYQAAADVAKKALKLDKSVFEVVTSEGILDAEKAREILDPKKMI